MIETHYYKARADGVKLYRTFSDQGYKIERDSVLYNEAIDPENSGRVYTETDEKIEETEV